MQHMDEKQSLAEGAGQKESTVSRSKLSIRTKVEVGVTLLAVGIAAIVFLFVTPSKITNASRISHLESIVKCPTCISVSTADANTASAIALRSYITTMVNSGASDQEVISQLEATYGKSVLLVPPNGYGALLVVGTVALALIIPFGFVISRVQRRRRSEARQNTESPSGDLLRDDQIDEEEQQDWSHHGVSGSDPGAEISRIDRVGKPRSGSRFSGLSLPQRIIGVVGVLFLLGGVSILGVSLISSSGNATNAPLTPNQISTLISNGQTLASFGQDKSALSAFSKVLIADPNQPVALAWNGWLLTKSGVSSKSNSLVSAGVAQLRQSIAVDGTYLYSRLFYGLVLANDLNNSTAAVAQFSKFFQLNPPPNLVTTIKSELVAVYNNAKIGLPTQLQ